MHKRMERVRNKGRDAEERAAAFLQESGFEILRRNLRIRHTGELDLLVRRGTELHIVEVKSGRPEEAMQRLNGAKLQHLMQTMSILLVREPELMEGVEDVLLDLLLVPDHGGKLRLMENVIPPELILCSGGRATCRIP